MGKPVKLNKIWLEKNDKNEYMLKEHEDSNEFEIVINKNGDNKVESVIIQKQTIKDEDDDVILEINTDNVYEIVKNTNPSTLKKFRKESSDASIFIDSLLDNKYDNEIDFQKMIHNDFLNNVRNYLLEYENKNKSKQLTTIKDAFQENSTYKDYAENSKQRERLFNLIAAQSQQYKEPVFFGSSDPFMMLLKENLEKKIQNINPDWRIVNMMGLELEQVKKDSKELPKEKAEKPVSEIKGNSFWNNISGDDSGKRQMGGRRINSATKNKLTENNTTIQRPSNNNNKNG